MGSLYYIGIKKIIVLGMMIGGYIVSPEASQILYHYCFGNGETLVLESDYIKTSPVIIKNIKTMKNGESRRVGFTQNEDWRLSYAINGFTMKKIDNKVVIEQYIKFSGEQYTDLNFIFFKKRVSDGIVNEFDTKPFLLYHEFTID